MKVCVLGNSHAGSFKRGWDRLRERAGDTRLVFFASRQNGLAGLRAEGGALVPATPALARDSAYTSGGLERIVVADYDVFLTVGLGLRLPVLDARLSAAVQAQVCRDQLARALNLRLVQLVRSVSPAPIWIAANPQRAADAEPRPAPHRLPYVQVHRVMQAQLGLDGATLLAQPAATLADGWHTDARFAKGSLRLDVGDRISNEAHDEGEPVHMNEDYGLACVEAFVAAARAALGAAPAAVVAPAA